MEMGPVTNFIKDERIQWFGHIMRRNENDSLRAAFEWIPKEKQAQKKMVGWRRGRSERAGYRKLEGSGTR